MPDPLCPSCGDSLRERFAPRHGGGKPVPVLACSQHGVFVAPDGIKLISGHTSGMDVEPRVGSDVRKCPACLVYMEQVSLNGVPVDQCVRCEGLWFDAGELQQVAKAEVELAANGERTSRLKLPEPSDALVEDDLMLQLLVHLIKEQRRPRRRW